MELIDSKSRHYALNCMHQLGKTETKKIFELKQHWWAVCVISQQNLQR